MGSLTKLITATVLTMQDAVDLPVSQCLPEIGNVVANSVKIGDLLAHRSGLPSGDALLCEKASRSWRSMIPGPAWPGPAFQPRDALAYSNLGPAIAARAARRVGNAAICAGAKSLLFEPLGIRSAEWSRQVTPGVRLHPFFLPSGGVRMTLADLVRLGIGWLRASRQEPDTPVRGEAAVKLFRPVVMDPAQRLGQGLGFTFLQAGRVALAGHTGSLPGCATLLLLAPQHNKLLVASARWPVKNPFNAPLCWGALAAAWTDLSPPVDMPSDRANELAGVYTGTREVAPGRLRTTIVEAKNGRLIVDGRGPYLAVPGGWRFAGTPHLNDLLLVFVESGAGMQLFRSGEREQHLRYHSQRSRP